MLIFCVDFLTISNSRAISPWHFHRKDAKKNLHTQIFKKKNKQKNLKKSRKNFALPINLLAHNVCNSRDANDRYLVNFDVRRANPLKFPHLLVTSDILKGPIYKLPLSGLTIICLRFSHSVTVFHRGQKVSPKERRRLGSLIIVIMRPRVFKQR